MAVDNQAHRRLVGKTGEDEAERFLKKKKYKIIARNVREGKSELDIIARDADTLVFVEVKSRVFEKGGEEALTRPADNVNKSKRTYLIRGANQFLHRNSDKYSSLYKRFDIIEVYFEKSKDGFSLSEIRHFENAL